MIDISGTGKLFCVLLHICTHSVSISEYRSTPKYQFEALVCRKNM